MITGLLRGGCGSPGLLAPGSCPPEGVTHCHPAPDTAIIPTQIIAVPTTQQHARHQHYTSDSLAGPRLHLRFSFAHLIFLLMIFGFHQTHTLEIWGWISKKWVRMRVKVRELTSDKLIIQSFNQPAGGARQPSQPSQPRRSRAANYFVVSRSCSRAQTAFYGQTCRFF